MTNAQLTAGAIESPLRKYNNLLMGVSLVLIAFAVYGSITTLIWGEATHGTSADVPWGILISGYSFFVGITTGLCVLSALGHLFNFPAFHVLSKRGMFFSFCAMLGGFLLIGMELGQPLRLIWTVFSPNLASPIWWIGALYSFYVVIILLELYFLIQRNLSGALTTGAVGFIVGVAAQSTLGGVFGTIHARPIWNGPYIPVFFIVSSIICAIAVMILLQNLLGPNEEVMSPDHKHTSGILTKLFGVTIGVAILSEFWFAVSALRLFAPMGESGAVSALMTGPLSLSYWLLQIIIGLAVPLALILMTRGANSRVNMLAAVMVLIGQFFMRYNLVIAGQSVPIRDLIPGAPLAAVDQFASYFPSFTEIALVLGAFGITLFLYLLAERFFNLGEEQETDH